MAKKKKKSFFAGKLSKSYSQRTSKGSRYVKTPKGFEVFNPQPNTKVTMDILPYVVQIPNHPDNIADDEIAQKGTPWYRMPFRRHRDVGPNKEKIVCPANPPFNSPCPVCEDIDKMRKEEDADDDLIGALIAKSRSLYIVRIVSIVDKDKKKTVFKEKKYQLFEFSDHQFEKVMIEQLEDQEEWEDFLDPEIGYSIKVTFSENKFNGGSFPKPTRFDFVNRKEQYTFEEIEEFPDLSECLTVLEYDDIADKYHLGVTEEEEEEETPKRKKKGKSLKQARAAIEDEDEDDEEFEDEDEDLEDEEEEDEDLEDEEEEDEDLEDDEDLEEDEDDEDEDEDEEFEDDEDEEEEFEDDDEDEEEEEEEEPVRKKRKPKKSSKKKGKKKK